MFALNPVLSDRSADGHEGHEREWFGVLGPRSTLPSGSECASRVQGSANEARPENGSANGVSARGGVGFDLPNWDGTFGMDAAAMGLRDRIDGDFVGTTEEILRWGACKWGFDERTVMAAAVVESHWRQSFTGDWHDGEPHSFGILQVKRTAHPGTYPASRDSTAFNVDYALGYQRACYEGYLAWLARVNLSYGAGDGWGCVGHWYSGGWHDGAAEEYTTLVRDAGDAEPWRTGNF